MVLVYNEGVVRISGTQRPFVLFGERIRIELSIAVMANNLVEASFSVLVALDQGEGIFILPFLVGIFTVSR